MKELNVKEIQAVNGGIGFFGGLIVGGIALDAYHGGISLNGLNTCVSFGQTIVGKISDYLNKAPAQVQNQDQA